MRIVLVSLFALLAACTKQNPEACCTDAVDCMNVGLPVGTTCDDGRLCRGNRCVEESCTTAGDCDLTAPYCVSTDEGRCSETCSADMQCPGFGQTEAEKFCVDGGCVQCRAGQSDCPIETPLCTPGGQCVACVAHADCDSGICAGGRCVTEDEIAYVATNGSAASQCTKSSPCSNVERALNVSPQRPYVLIDAGTYSSATAISLSGVRSLIGRGASRPVLTRTTNGPIVTTVGAVDAKLEYLEIFGATGTADPNKGIGIQCALGGAPKVELLDVVVRMSAVDGLRGQNCTVRVTKSSFSNNVGHGVALTDGTTRIDRSTVISNGAGLSLDGGVYVVTNSIIARNVAYGIDIYSVDNGNQVEFNTIMDNGMQGASYASGLNCNLQGSAVGTFANNIIARNRPFQTTGSQCTYPSSLLIDTDIAPLKLERPDAAPFDYHIQPGSVAIDAATASTIKTDFDGEARPAGGANDIGADELH